VYIPAAAIEPGKFQVLISVVPSLGSSPDPAQDPGLLSPTDWAQGRAQDLLRPATQTWARVGVHTLWGEILVINFNFYVAYDLPNFSARLLCISATSLTSFPRPHPQ
jgi:hypothetical protein